jgi:hypothetical protein
LAQIAQYLSCFHSVILDRDDGEVDVGLADYIDVVRPGVLSLPQAATMETENEHCQARTSRFSQDRLFRCSKGRAFRLHPLSSPTRPLPAYAPEGNEHKIISLGVVSWPVGAGVPPANIEESS